MKIREKWILELEQLVANWNESTLALSLAIYIKINSTFIKALNIKKRTHTKSKTLKKVILEWRRPNYDMKPRSHK